MVQNTGGVPLMESDRMAIVKIMRRYINVPSLLVVLFVFCLVLLFLDFAALHDIRNDYISKEILEYLGVTLSGGVPAWTDNSGEWRYLSVSLILRGLLYSSSLVLLFYLYRKRKRFPGQ